MKRGEREAAMEIRSKYNDGYCSTASVSLGVRECDELIRASFATRRDTLM